MAEISEAFRKTQSLEDLVAAIMLLMHSEATPTVDEVCGMVDAYLGLIPYAHLLPRRGDAINEILRRVRVRIGDATIMEEHGGLHEKWLPDLDRTTWRLWPRLDDYLRRKEGMPPSVVKELNSSTDEVLSRLESPNRPGTWDRRGLVVGHVQSGKTTHYTALAAKALDAGYQIVIVLAGVHNSLRSQTHERFDKHLLGRDSAALLEAIRAGRAPHGAPVLGVGSLADERGDPGLEFSILTCTTSGEDGDFSRKIAGQIQLNVSSGTRLVIVVKKNAILLPQLAKWLRTLSAGTGKQGLVSAPTLVIDDEADHASINTKDDDDDPTTINREIRLILKGFERVGFVGYTATPFANIFIPTEGSSDTATYGPDLFPSAFIASLKAPSNYVGPDVVFGHPGDESVGLPERLPLPMHVAVDDADEWMPDRHKKTHVPGPLPPSVFEALRLFVITCATREARGHREHHSSMLLHVTRFINVQDRVCTQVKRAMEVDREVLELGAQGAIAELERRYREIWLGRLASQHDAFVERFGSDCPPLPEWPDVWSRVVSALARISVIQVNGESQDALAYSRTPAGRWVVAIGGDKLSRGLTLEGLAVSYFLRTSNMFDTLMQMGRWFGYRHGYVDLCRVYTTPLLMNAFREIALAMEELRSDFDRMAAADLTPEKFGLRVRAPSDRLLITAANKIRRGEQVGVRFASELVQVLEVQRDGAVARCNEESLQALIAGLGAPRREVRGRKTSHFIWKTTADRVLEFLGGYEAYATPSFFMQCEALRRYIEEQLKNGELREWAVAIVSQGQKDDPNPVHLGTVTVPRVMRTPSEGLGSDRFGTQALVGKADEGLDLSEAEYNKALRGSRTTKAGGVPTVPDREEMRNARPADRGLLLIYLVRTTEYSQSGYVPAIAISFPESTTAKPLAYTVNETWRREHGLVEDDDE